MHHGYGIRYWNRKINAHDWHPIIKNDSADARTIAQLEPLGNPGSDRLKLLFSVDSERYLRITVEDLLTQET